MTEKKNIDHLFQNNLEHFEVAPPEMVWENIEAKLKEKEEKRRVFPFWWKFAGTAAILFLGFGLYTAYFTDTTQKNNPIVKQDNTTTNQQDNSVTTKKLNATTNKEIIAEGHGKSDESNADGITTANPSAENNNNTNLRNKTQNSNEVVVSVSNNKKKTANSKKKTTTKKDINVNSNTSLASGNVQSQSNKNKQNPTNGKINSEKVTLSNTGIANGVAESGKETKNSFDVTTPSDDKNNSTKLERKTELSLVENSDKKLEEIKKIDSTKLAVVEPNALEELLNEKEKKITKERKLNRWQVTPNIAPIYFSSLSNGSPLDEKLEDNKKIYGTNYSYGLAVNYSLNKKYSIRTGVHSYSVDYDTKDIVFYQDSNPSKMQNLSPNLQGSFIQIEPLSNVNTNFGRILGEKFEGSLNQKTSYIEVPFEVTYKVISKKFGVDVIGGISTMFLNQNAVYLEGSGFNMRIGEASNLNSIHFSTNVGLGLKYAFLKRFDARIEPLFKYQINTYSSGAGNFKPYIFGIYSGISYHF